MFKYLVLTLLATAVSGECPNACSGHGKCFGKRAESIHPLDLLKKFHGGFFLFAPLHKIKTFHHHFHSSLLRAPTLPKKSSFDHNNRSMLPTVPQWCAATSFCYFIFKRQLHVNPFDPQKNKLFGYRNPPLPVPPHSSLPFHSRPTSTSTHNNFELSIVLASNTLNFFFFSFLYFLRFQKHTLPLPQVSAVPTTCAPANVISSSPIAPE